MHPRIADGLVAVSGQGGGDPASSEEVPRPAGRGETVLEVGPGQGILTAALLAHGAHVIAVETDVHLIEGLEGRFKEEVVSGQLELVHADIRNFLAQPQELTTASSRGYHVVANIPYYLTGEILRRLLESKHQPRSMTLLVQKEVAERIAREKKESLLSLSVKAYGTPRYAFTVPKGAFRPAPKVDSAVLTTHGISRDNFKNKKEETLFFTLIRAGFAHKRKRLAKNLADAGFAKEAARVGEARAEDLSLADWLALVQHS